MQNIIYLTFALFFIGCSMSEALTEKSNCKASIELECQCECDDSDAEQTGLGTN